MSDEQDNKIDGQPVINQPVEATAGVPPQLAALLNQPISIVTMTMIRGIVDASQVPGINPVQIMCLIAYHTGMVSASMLSGPLDELLRARKAIKEAFNEGLNKANLNQSFPQQPKPGGMMMPQLRRKN